MIKSANIASLILIIGKVIEVRIDTKYKKQ